MLSCEWATCIHEIFSTNISSKQLFTKFWTYEIITTIILVDFARRFSCDFWSIVGIFSPTASVSESYTSPLLHGNDNGERETYKAFENSIYYDS